MKTSTAQYRLWIAEDRKAARDPGCGVVVATKTGIEEFSRESQPCAISHFEAKHLKSMVHDACISDACT